MFYIFLSVTLIVFLLFAQEHFRFKSFICSCSIVYVFFQFSVVDWLLNFNLILGILAILLNTVWFSFTILFSYYLHKINSIFKGYCFFILLWLINEYTHLYGVLKWPWLNLGNFFGFAPNLVQWYEYTGIGGGTLWILIFSCLLHYFLKNNKLIILLYILIVIILPLLISVSLKKSNIKNYGEVKITFEQTPTNCNNKCDIENIEYSVLEISKKDSSLFSKKRQKDHCIIFPEGYIQTPSTTNFISTYFSKSNTLKKIGPHVSILFGGILFEKTKTEIKYYNVVWVYSKKKVKVYKKTKLVPVFEENVLLQKQIQNVLVTDFQMGSITANFINQQPIASESGEYLINICYEVAFGAFIASKTNFYKSVVFVLSNDEWIKSLKGKLQHFNFSKLRAIETRRMLVIVTNKGFSGIVDENGNLISLNNGNKEKWLNTNINFLGTKTFYAKHGDWLYVASFLLFIISIIKNLIKKRHI